MNTNELAQLINENRELSDYDLAALIIERINMEYYYNRKDTCDITLDNITATRRPSPVSW